MFEFCVNFQYLMAIFFLVDREGSDAKSASTLSSLGPGCMGRIRDLVLLIVGNKTYAELQNVEGKKQLKGEILAKINGSFQTGEIKVIYFTNSVIQ